MICWIVTFLKSRARYDGSSKFTRGKQSMDFFPSVSTGWRISEEAFFEPIKGTLNYAKFRASYGSLGNNSGVGRYEQKETFETTNYVLDGKVIKGFSYSKMIDPEFLMGINIGLKHWTGAWGCSGTSCT